MTDDMIHNNYVDVFIFKLNLQLWHQDIFSRNKIILVQVAFYTLPYFYVGSSQF